MNPLLLVLLTLASPAEGKMTTPDAALRAAARFTAPKGWTVTDYANSGGADPVKAFAKGADRITLSLYGAKGSAYGSAAAFMKGPAATTMGRAPEAAGQVLVGGRKLAAYRRGFPLMHGDPHAAASLPPAMGRERFVVLPLKDGRFLVAAHAVESPIPSLAAEGPAAFEAFLKSLRPLEK